MKVLIIGLGSIAKKHIHALNQIGGAEIFALRSSLDSQKFENVHNLYSFQEIEGIAFDFFLISNPTGKHAETLERLIKFRKPFFIEKPLFERVGGNYQSLVEKIRQFNIPTYVACSLRFLDSLLEIKRIIRDHHINEVNSYSGSFLPDWRPGVDFRKTYSANKSMGGGVHIDLIHELDYLYWLFGEPLKTHSIFSSKSSLNIDAVDYANYLWEYETFCASVILNYYRRDTRRTLEIVTSSDTFFVDILKNKIYRNDMEIFSSRQLPTDTYLPQMEFFIKNVVNGAKTEFNSVNEAYKILELCLKD